MTLGDMHIISGAQQLLSGPVFFLPPPTTDLRPDDTSRTRAH